MKTRFIGLAVGALSLGLLATPASAISYGGLTAGAFCGAFDCSSAVFSLWSTGDFAPAPIDTDNYSAVFAGTGANTGIFAYLYYIEHRNPSTEAVISGMTIEYSSRVAALGLDAFYISDIAGVVPNSASDVPGVRMKFNLEAPYLLPGQNTTLFGFFSRDPYAIVKCNQLDTGDESTPSCLAPRAVPEPTSMFLLGASLLGFAGVMRGRRRG